MNKIIDSGGAERTSVFVEISAPIKRRAGPISVSVPQDVLLVSSIFKHFESYENLAGNFLKFPEEHVINVHDVF